MPDLAARIAQARQSLAAGAPQRDPELEENARAVRAAINPAYAAELEREHAYELAQSRGGYARRSRSGEKQSHCESCYRFVTHASAECRACGHVPDPAIGHRQVFRDERQKRLARSQRAARNRKDGRRRNLS